MVGNGTDCTKKGISSREMHALQRLVRHRTDKSLSLIHIWLYPLDDLIADKSITDDALLDLDGLMQSSVDAQRYEDKLYGLPVCSDVYKRQVLGLELGSTRIKAVF